MRVQVDSTRRETKKMPQLRLQVNELKVLVNRNPHMPLGEVQRAEGAVQEIIWSLRERELLKILDKKEVKKLAEYKQRKAEKMEEMIQKAKQKVISAYERSGITQRSWLEASPPDSYSNKAFRVTIFVLEGSPCKGYIIVNYATATVRAFGCHDKPLWTYNASYEYSAIG